MGWIVVPFSISEDVTNLSNAHPLHRTIEDVGRPYRLQAKRAHLLLLGRDALVDSIHGILRLTIQALFVLT